MTAPKSPGDHIHVFGGIGVKETSDGVEVAQIAPIREGHPMAPGTEILRRIDGCCFESVGKVPGGHSGPAQVASPAYRESYERIFGGRAERGQA